MNPEKLSSEAFVKLIQRFIANKEKCTRWEQEKFDGCKPAASVGDVQLQPLQEEAFVVPLRYETNLSHVAVERTEELEASGRHVWECPGGSERASDNFQPLFSFTLLKQLQDFYIIL